MTRRITRKSARPAGTKAAAKPAAKAPVTQVKESAQKIWLAGLGAVSKAQREGSKVADVLASQASSLVAEGRKIETRLVSAAVEKARDVQAAATAFAQAKSNDTRQSLGKLEGVFESRVSRTLNTFGIPSSKQVRELIVHMEELQASLAQLKRVRAG